MLAKSDLFPPACLFLFAGEISEMNLKLRTLLRSLLNEVGLACDGERESQEFPVSFLHRFKRIVGDFHARRYVRSPWDSCHVDPAVTHVIGVFENRLISGVPVSHWTFHVTGKERIMKLDVIKFAAATYTQKGS